MIKLRLLSDGIRVDESCINAFSLRPDLMERRRAYNDSRDRSLSRSSRIPQEINVGEVMISVNHRQKSPYSLIAIDGNFFISRGQTILSICQIPKRPNFLNAALANGTKIDQIANLYGGYSLAFFSPATCYYFGEGIQCKYCSLEPNRDLETAYVNVIAPTQAAECLEIALRDKNHNIRQIMVVGGNERDYDAGFHSHVTMVKALHDVLVSLNLEKTMQIHLAAMPPKDHRLIAELAPLACRVTFNLEVYDDRLFEQHCSGKFLRYGRQHLKDALEEAVRFMPNRVHSILIVGLEPHFATFAGIDWLLERGIHPITNIFHNDVGAIYEKKQRPTYQTLLEVALFLQSRHSNFDIQPYWNGCGRNALDYEAKHGWF